MSRFKVKIAGTGSCVPDKVLTNDDLSKIVETNDEWITKRSGIKQRRIASEKETPSTLGALAGARAMEVAGVKPEEIELVIVGTSNPDHLFPTTACLIQSHLGLVNAGAFDLLAACSGFLYAFSIGSQYIRTGQYSKILVVGAEVLTRITNWKDRATCVLFGDGAGAAVLTRSEDASDVLYTELGADGYRSDLIKLPAGGAAMPSTTETLATGKNVIHMEGRQVYEFAVRKLGELSTRGIQKAGLTPDDVQWFLPHQMNIRIIESTAQKTNIPAEKIIITIDKYGNTSASSIPIALDESVRSGRIKRGDVVVSIALGAGLTWATAVFRF